MAIRDAFRMLVRACIAIVAIVYSGLYTWRITFVPNETVNDEYAKIILGFLLGTLVTTIINFYLGGSDNAIQPNKEPTPAISSDPSTIHPFSGVPTHGNEAHLRNDTEGKSGVDDGSV